MGADAEQGHPEAGPVTAFLEQSRSHCAETEAQGAGWQMRLQSGGSRGCQGSKTVGATGGNVAEAE